MSDKDKVLQELIVAILNAAPALIDSNDSRLKNIWTILKHYSQNKDVTNGN